MFSSCAPEREEDVAHKQVTYKGIHKGGVTQSCEVRIIIGNASKWHMKRKADHEQRPGAKTVSATMLSPIEIQHEP